MILPATARIRKRSRLRFPAAGGFAFVEGQGLGPGEQVGGQRDDLQPDPVLGVVVERQVPHPGVLEGSADAVLGPGALPVPDLEFG